MSGEVRYRVENGVGAVVFDRPEARNAMTWSMYDALGRICDAIAADTIVNNDKRYVPPYQPGNCYHQEANPYFEQSV